MNTPDWLSGRDSAPAFKITLNGKDITTRLESRLISLTLTDNRGFEADQLDIELDDADGAVDLPSRGVQLELQLGWKGEPMINKGTFTIDEIGHSGAPDKVTLRGRSADFRNTLNIKREKSYSKTTIGEIVKQFAARHKLEQAISPQMATIVIDHIDQTNESDGSFLMRLARRVGAIAAVKYGKLLFIKQGQGVNASGKPLPAMTIVRADGDEHQFTLADREAYTGVSASWLDTKAAKPQTVKVKRKRKRKTNTAKAPSQDKQGEYLVGTDDNVYVLSRIYANASNARRAAKANWERIQRGAAQFSITLARGRAELYPEVPVSVKGFKRQIDAADWTITTVTHTVAGGGFTTALELEVKISDLDME